MKKFILIYHTTSEAYDTMAKSTLQQGQERIKAWHAWRDSLGDKIVDFGAPLFEGVRIHADGTNSKTPRDVTGFTIIKAKDIDAAVELSNNHPHFDFHIGCEIEVRELEQM